VLRIPLVLELIVNAFAVPGLQISSSVVYQDILEKVHAEIAPVIGKGSLPGYIPALAEVDPASFGIALVSVTGEVAGVGEWLRPFSVQSLSKVFAFSLVLASDGAAIWHRVGHEPSVHRFDSVIDLELDRGIPRNPLVNAGALVTVDRLLSLTGDAQGELLEFLREECGNPYLEVDEVVAKSELDGAHRNAALAHLMAEFGNLHNPVAEVLAHYSRQCAIAMSCRDVALAARFLARRGVLADGTRLLPAGDTKRLNATMLVAGMYDRAGEVAYRVGLPAKSGVGGGIVAVVPNRCTLCVWSPGLDEHGNSVAGVAALDAFTTLTGWSVF